MKMGSDIIGGVRSNIDLLKNDLQIINERFLSSATVQHRLRSVGMVTEAQAKELGTVGHAARASGVPIDVRHEASQGAYKILPLPMRTEVGGDCWSRARLRITEMEASLSWLSTILMLYPDWPRSRSVVGSLAPSQLVISIVEGWRGEVVHCLETDDRGRLAHYKVQDPSLRNWMGLAVAVRGNEISDFPICNKSFDLSYCGNDL
jgi:Ni,Fe-hydrogenase III large subunit